MVAGAEFKFVFEDRSGQSPAAQPGYATAAATQFATTRSPSAAGATGETSYSGNFAGAASVASRVAKGAGSAIDAATGTAVGSQAVSALGTAARIATGTLAGFAAGAAIVVGGLYAAEKALEAMRNATNKAAKELVGFSGPLANAAAQQNALGVMRNVRRGQEMGGVLARYTEAQGQYQRAAQRFSDTFIPVFTEVAVPLLKEMASILKETSDLVKKTLIESQIVAANIEILATSDKNKKLMLQMAVSALQAIKDSLGKEDEPPGDLLEQFWQLGPKPQPHAKPGAPFNGQVVPRGPNVPRGGM